MTIIKTNITCRSIGSYQVEIIEFLPHQPCSYLEKNDKGILEWVIKRYEDRSNALLVFEKRFDSREEAQLFIDKDKLFKKIFKAVTFAYSKI